MGASMAGHLLDAGHPLFVYNRTRRKTDGLVKRGATLCESPGAAAARADMAITIVGYPKDVEQVYLGEDGILANLKKGGVAMDMTTSSPLLAEKIATKGKSAGIEILDAPVSGGDLGARSATLSIMVGGSEAAFALAQPIFKAMGSNIVYQGKAGAGQSAKICNQIAIAGGMVAIAESLSYARSSGLDPKCVLQSISAGAAGSWSMSNLAPRALEGDFAPGFFIRHFIKDVGIALEAAEKIGLELPAVAHAKKLYEELAAAGSADDGTQALFR